MTSSLPRSAPSPRFTADQLRTFAAVVECHTFEEAAVELGVTSSAVSQRIKAMERACGQILLRRTNPVQPTAPGETVLRLARQTEQLAQDALRELAGRTGPRTLAVAVNADSLATWFLDALAEIPREEQVYCDVRREDERHSSALLRAGTVMAALTSDPHPVQGCTVESLGRVRYWAVAAPDFLRHWLPDLPPLQGPGLPAGVPTARALAAVPVVQYDRTDESMIAQALRTLGGTGAEGAAGPLGPRVHIPSSGDYARAVERGLGWGVVPELQCGPALAEGSLVRLGLGPLDVELWWQRWSLSSPALDLLTESVRRCAGRALLP